MARRHLTNAYDQLHKTLNDISANNSIMFNRYHADQLSLVKLTISLIKSERAERKAKQKFNRSVVVD